LSFIPCLYLSLLHVSDPQEKERYISKEVIFILKYRWRSVPVFGTGVTTIQRAGCQIQITEFSKASGNLFYSNAFAHVHGCGWNFSPVSDSPLLSHQGTSK
jgi:hypothetical protein